VLNSIRSLYAFCSSQPATFLPLFGAISVCLLDIIFTGSVNLTDPTFNLIDNKKESSITTFASQTGNLEIIVDEFKNRLLYYFSELTVTFFFLITILVSAYSIYISLREAKIKNIPLIFAFIIIIGLGLFTFAFYNYKTYALMENLLNALERYSQVPVSLINRIQHGISLFTILFLVTAFCAVLINDEGSGKQAAKLLRAERLRLKTLLYLGAALLVSGVAAIYFSDRWMGHMPAEIFISNDANKAVAEIGNIHTTVKGFFYTLLLLSIYIPAALVFQLRGESLYFAENHEGTIEHKNKWMEENGISLTLKESFAHTAALFAPLLTGLSGSVMEIIKTTFA